MSAPKLPLALTPKAETDLRDIEAYTLEQWGVEQWIAYEAALDQAFLAIGENPALGRARDEIRPGYRAHAVRQHLIVYRITRQAVVVIGIISARMDLRRALRD